MWTQEVDAGDVKKVVWEAGNGKTTFIHRQGLALPSQYCDFIVRRSFRSSGCQRRGGGRRKFFLLVLVVAQLTTTGKASWGGRVA